MGLYDRIRTASNVVVQCPYQTAARQQRQLRSSPPTCQHSGDFQQACRRSVVNRPTAAPDLIVSLTDADSKNCCTYHLRQAPDEASRVQLQSRRNVPMYGAGAMQLHS
jgi:hypothetical protein